MWSCKCVFATFARERKRDTTRTDALSNLVKTKNNPKGESEHQLTIIESDSMLKTLKQQKKKPYKYTGPKICNNDETQEHIVVLWSPEEDHTEINTST